MSYLFINIRNTISFEYVPHESQRILLVFKYLVITFCKYRAFCNADNKKVK